MSKAVPWSDKDEDFDSRAAKDAGRREGASLGDWMNRSLVERSAETGAEIEGFNADERLEAIAAQLARLSREAEANAAPQRRRGEAGRRSAPREGAAPAAERPRVKGAVKDGEPEAQLERAVETFRARVDRVEAGTARALADVADIVEESEARRSTALETMRARLAEIEARLRRNERAPLDEPPAVDRDDGFYRLERRFDSLLDRLERQNPRAHDRLANSPRRDRERDISAIAARQRDLDAQVAPPRPPLAALIEDRFDALSRKLDRAGDAAPVSGGEEKLDRLQQGIEALSRQLERTRDEFARSAAARAALPARDGEATAPEIDALARQIADIGQDLAEVARRSQLTALEQALSELGERVERSRADGLREAVLAPIDTLSRDLRRALAESSLAAPIENVAGQLRDVEAKLEDVRLAGWADRDDFVKLRDQSEELRAMIVVVAENLAPLERIERQVAALSERLDQLAARLDAAPAEGKAPVAPSTLEPLLRALAEKLETAAAPQADSRAMEALERQVADVSARMERGDEFWGQRFDHAVERLAKRLEQARLEDRESARAALFEALTNAPHARDEQAARDIAELREQRDTASQSARQTLSAVHETLEKVVDRLAMLEDEVLEARAGQGGGAAAPQAPLEADDFLLEPGAGRPLRAEGVDQGPRASAFGDQDGAVSARAAQANYIDVARRAIAARAAAESAQKAEAEQRLRVREAEAGDAGHAPESMVYAPPKSRERFSGRRHVAALLALAGAVLAAGAYQAYRIFDLTPPAAVEPHVEAAPPVEDRAADAPAAPESAAPAITPAQDSAASAPAETPPAEAPPTEQPASPAPVDTAPTGSIEKRPSALNATQLAMLKDMAGKGEAAAQFDLGARFIEGRGVARDPAAAIHWFEKAAAQGLAQAQFRLGVICEKGVGTARDAGRAAELYEKAATQGHARAMHNLAVMRAEGVDGKPDYAGAAQWFRRAADYGVRDSQYNLAVLYARGIGVGQNLGQSYVWFDIAARQGDADAAKKRDEVGARLDAATLAAAKKQAEEFSARTPPASVNEPPPVPHGAAAAAILLGPAHRSR